MLVQSPDACLAFVCKSGLRMLDYSVLRNLTLVFGSKNWSPGPGSGLKSLLDALGAVLAKYQPKRSHRDPKQTLLDIFFVLWSSAPRKMCWAGTLDTCFVDTKATCALMTLETRVL